MRRRSPASPCDPARSGRLGSPATSRPTAPHAARAHDLPPYGDRRQVRRCLVEPGAVRGVHRDPASSDQRLALADLGSGLLDASERPVVDAPDRALAKQEPAVHLRHDWCLDSSGTGDCEPTSGMRRRGRAPASSPGPSSRRAPHRRTACRPLKLTGCWYVRRPKAGAVRTMSHAEALERAIEQSHAALAAIIGGDVGGYVRLYSERRRHHDRQSLRPFARGRHSVIATGEAAAARYRDGEILGFESATSHVGDDLACVVEVERYPGEGRQRRRAGAGRASRHEPVSLGGRRVAPCPSSCRPDHHATRRGVCAAAVVATEARPPAATRRLTIKGWPAEWR